MNQTIRNLTSLGNFSRAKNASGQISTLLILLTVMMLGFVLVTANLGQISAQSTALANAADMAALQLGSQLASKANQLFLSLKNCDGMSEDDCDNTTFYTSYEWGGRPALCAKTGWAAVVIAAIVAIAATVLAIVTWGGTSALGYAAYVGLFAAIGGAVGGMAGAAIAGTNILTGALVGFGVGLSIGLMAVGGEAIIAGLGDVAAGGLTFGEIVTFLGSKAGVAALWKLAGGTLSLAFSMVPWKQYQEGLSDAGRIIAESLGKLNEPDRVRESVVYSAMSLIVDDPNQARDYGDADDDGNTIHDLVPAFFDWYVRRLDRLKDIQNINSYILLPFIDGPMTTYRNFAYSAYAGWEYLWYGPNATGVAHEPGFLESADYRFYFMDETGSEALVDNAGNDGFLVDAFRDLEAVGRNISFWAPGPTAAQIQAAADAGQEDPPAGYDQLDDMVGDLRRDVSYIQGLLMSDRDKLIKSWTQWLPYFYDERDDPANPTTVYGRLTRNLARVQSWQHEMDGIVQHLPVCVYDPSTGVLTNAPCIYSAGGISGSTDSDPMTDEISRMYQGFEFLYYFLSMLQGAIRSAYDQVQANMKDEYFASLGGLNPVTYIWSDKRGTHSVVVELGDYQIPTIQSVDHGNWFSGSTCSELFYFSNDQNTHGCSPPHCNQAWVKITRYGGSSPMGFLGRWNPFGPNWGISKAAEAYYSYDKVGLKNRS